MTKLVPIGRAAPVAVVIDEAQKLLERAKSGEIRSLIWIADAGDSYLHGMVSAGTDRVLTLGQLARLMHRVQTHLDEHMGSV